MQLYVAFIYIFVAILVAAAPTDPSLDVAVRKRVPVSSLGDLSNVATNDLPLCDDIVFDVNSTSLDANTTGSQGVDCARPTNQNSTVVPRQLWPTTCHYYGANLDAAESTRLCNFIPADKTIIAAFPNICRCHQWKLPNSDSPVRFEVCNCDYCLQKTIRRLNARCLAIRNACVVQPWHNGGWKSGGTDLTFMDLFHKDSRSHMDGMSTTCEN